MVVSSVPPISPVHQLAALGVRCHEQVGAVVERDLRPAVEQRDDVRHVAVQILAAQCPNLDGFVEHQRRRDVILRVDSGFAEQSATTAPPAFSARTRFAVSAVTCRQAAIRIPSSGRSAAKRSPILASTGI